MTTTGAMIARLKRAKLAREQADGLAAARAASEAAGAGGRAILMGQVVGLNEHSQGDGTWVMGYIQGDDGSTRIPFVGSELPGCDVGNVVRLVGQWESHHEHGLQFRAQEVETRLPKSGDAVVRYLVAQIPGCGETRAKAVVERLGGACLEVLAHDPSRIREVFAGRTGDTLAARFQAWSAGWQERQQHEQQHVMLMGAGMTFKQARRVQQFFAKKGEAEDVVLRHPYRLIEVPGIGFKRADDIARGMGVDPRDPSRIAAGVVYALETAMEVGDSAIPRPKLERQAQDALQIDEATLVATAIDTALAAGTLVDDDGLIFLPRVLETEQRLAAQMIGLVQASRPLTAAQRAIVEPIIRQSQVSLTQARAVWMALEHGVAILTGRPGSGKTTTTRTFTQCCAALGWSVELAAPTGKAASRAAEVTGLPAKTVHRLLGGTPGSTRPDPLEARVVILDETSMADLELVAWVARNLDPRRSSLLLVGDKDQLPSVGHGSVLADLIASGVIPTVHLTEIFRQAQGSRIIVNAHRLLDDEPLLLDGRRDTADFLFADITATDAIGPDGFPLADDPDRSRREQEKGRVMLRRTIEMLVRERGAIPVRDIQVLTPMRKNLLGVESLNPFLQDILNPAAPGQAEGPMIGGGTRVRVGDRVIQVRNDYSIPGGLFNGEQGEVVETHAAQQQVTVRFDEERTLVLKAQQLGNLRLAWAITVHRSQGSEFPFTILLYHTSHFMMLDKALLYTGITRARKMFVLIGNYRALEVTQREGRKAAGRHTGLAKRLRAAADAALDPGELAAA